MKQNLFTFKPLTWAMSKIPRNTYECRDCDRTVHIWHRVDSRDGYTGKYTPASVGCPECETYMDRVETDD